MTDPMTSLDVLVLGGGPSGQKAAIQAAKLGRRVALVDREAAPGGQCVHRGTIPSKTLRENALYLSGLRRQSQGGFDVEIPPGTEVAQLMRGLDGVQKGHQSIIAAQLDRNGIELVRGKARFLSAHEVEVRSVGGKRSVLRAELIVIATGSRPRTPAQVPVDHENVLDSDSILSLIYLPRSLTILGGGVIATEFASIFNALGVGVAMIDDHPRPLGFLDRDLTDRFVDSFEERGGRFLGSQRFTKIEADRMGSVTVELESGEVVRSEKLLCALGRVADLEGLDVQAAGLEPGPRGHLPVDTWGRTAVAHIYAVGDAIGPPALAATAMEQGRRAMRHAFGLDADAGADLLPIGIYSIPEMASVGLTEEQALKRHGACTVGRAPFDELARGLISKNADGLVKLVADASGRKLLGAHIVGEGATELVHVAQMALRAGFDVDVFVENVFNFPTLAEGFRVASLDILGQRARKKAV